LLSNPVNIAAIVSGFKAIKRKNKKPAGNCHMETRIIHKAKKGAYPDYAEMYMKWSPDDGLVLQQLQHNFLKVKQFISTLDTARLLHRYAPGKWSIKEVLVHIVDDERIFSYRALRFARNEKMNLIGFNQDAYVLHSEADERSLESIFDEYEAVRKATIALFNGLPENSLDRLGHGTGTANDATPRALLYHIAGHEQHHIHIIRDRYL
jgi:uncharacterized damage-inducible protein DinB